MATYILTYILNYYVEKLYVFEQILGDLKEDSSCVQPVDIPVAERVPLNNWRTQRSANRPSEIPPKSPVFAGRCPRPLPGSPSEVPLLGNLE